MSSSTGKYYHKVLKHKILRTTNCIVFLLSVLAVHARTDLNIWEGTATEKVVMTAYPVAGEGHPAVIVCPGGSYLFHDMKGEGEDVARWLNQHGISAFVLKYRTANSFVFFSPLRYLVRNSCHPRPRQDLLRAVAQVRADAARWGVDKNRVGVMGFSAGGHLAMSAVESAVGEARPGFDALIYPVVTMSGPYVHKRSRRALLGLAGQHDPVWQDSLSLEKHVPSGCPPVFMVQCKDDPVVHYRNTELLDSALTAVHVPHTFIQYETGGHGFGASGMPETSESAQWKKSFLEWLEKLEK
ncbi:MAG: alpha/beta hydrolase [Bacteroidales bacterium]|nr:alpha/beta hydrolase [Bacteroidales bacterium]